MNGWKRLAERYPVFSFLALCYVLTWLVWFSIPNLAGSEWTLIKIWTGVGLGPGLAAVLLDRLRHGPAPKDFDRGWWTAFAIVGGIVLFIDVWSLLGGDGPVLASIPETEPVGLSISGVLGSILSGAAAGFIFAMARGSSSKTLNSITRLRVGLHWWLVALLLPALVYTAGIGASILLGGAIQDLPLMGADLSVTLPLVGRAALFTYLVVCVGEETGWRGYLLPELQRRFSPLVATLWIGLIWGIWHLPLWIAGLYPGNAGTGVLFYIVFCSALAVLFTWMFNRTGGVLSLALVLHMSINTTNKLLPTALWAGVVLVLLAGWLVYHERMWSKTSS